MKKKLSIPLLDGEIWQVDAEIIGDLAIHPMYKHEDDFVSITHVPTLLTFRKAVPIEICGEWNKKHRAKLIKWMKKVQEGMPKDWSALRRLTPEKARTDLAYSDILRERVKKHCLAIKDVK